MKKQIETRIASPHRTCYNFPRKPTRRGIMKRCITCKNDIIRFGEEHLTGFRSIFPPKEFDKACYFVMRDGRGGPYYPFVQRSEAGSFWHLRIERGFWNDQIHLRLNSFYVSYILYDWSVAMCTYRADSYSGYGRLNSISEKYTVCSPWFDTDNDKDSLQKGLADLGAWYEAHLPEIHLSYDKQQTWLDKDYRDAKIVRAYLDQHLPELTEGEIFELYRTVDRLAAQYVGSEMETRKTDLGYPAPLSSFNDFCYGKLPPKINVWVNELSEVMLSKKVVKGITIDYARSFAVKALLYLFHDSQEASHPAILKHEELWK